MNSPILVRICIVFFYQRLFFLAKCVDQYQMLLLFSVLNCIFSQDIDQDVFAYKMTKSIWDKVTAITYYNSFNICHTTKLPPLEFVSSIMLVIIQRRITGSVPWITQTTGCSYMYGSRPTKLTSVYWRRSWLCEGEAVRNND